METATSSRIRLGVNIDHVATLRQARGVAYPSPVEAALLAMQGGADGITIHVREDRRHIQVQDLFDIRALPGIPLNLEMAATQGMLAIALEARPDEVCLVPERREEVTTEGGLDAAGQFDKVAEITARLKEAGIMVSLFIEPSFPQIEAARQMGAPVIELHTGRYCNVSGKEAAAELRRLAEAAELAHELGLTVNAGHGLNTNNTAAFIQQTPHLHTLNIGHSIVARAIAVGMPAAVAEMVALIASAR